MKIAIDARTVNRSGIGICVKAWLKGVGYSFALGVEKNLRPFTETAEIVPFDCDQIYGYKEQLKFPRRALRKKKPDVLHVPHCNVPMFYRGKMIVTIHDLTHLVYPEFLPLKPIVHLYFKFIFWFACKRADKIMTVSENTKRDLLRFFKVDEKKIRIITLGYGKHFRKKQPEELEFAYEKFGIPKGKKILLYVGNMLPHKNLNALLEALSLMPEREACRLVLVGKTFANRAVRTREEELGVKDFCIRAGEVSDEDLVALYNIADLFVLPSLYEGFGLPVLEAFACGTPVACSNTSSLPEVGGKAAKYFDPKNPADMAKVIGENLNLKGTCDAEIEAQLSKFSWEKSCEQIREVAREVCGE